MIQQVNFTAYFSYVNARIRGFCNVKTNIFSVLIIFPLYPLFSVIPIHQGTSSHVLFPPLGAHIFRLDHCMQVEGCLPRQYRVLTLLLVRPPHWLVVVARSHSIKRGSQPSHAKVLIWSNGLKSVTIMSQSMTRFGGFHKPLMLSRI